MTWGIKGDYPFGLDERDTSMENFKGLQIEYPINGTIEEQLEDQKKTMIFTKVKKVVLVFNVFTRQCRESSSLHPSVAKSSCGLKKSVKPLIVPPKEKEKEPPCVFLKLDTFGKRDSPRQVYNLTVDADETAKAINFLFKVGRYSTHPVVRWKHIYWGSHGQTSYVASAKLVIVNANMTKDMAVVTNHS